MKKLSQPSSLTFSCLLSLFSNSYRRLVLLSLVSLLIWIPSEVEANNDLVMIRVGGHLITAEHIVKGPLNLFVYAYFRPETIDTGLRVVPAGTVEEKRFFLGVNGEVIEITSSNYKKMIKRHLPNAKHLHKRLGKVGFRFQNLSSMIQFYNDFRAKQQYVYVQE